VSLAHIADMASG